MMWWAVFALILGTSYGQNTHKDETHSRQLLSYPSSGIPLSPQPTIYPITQPRVGFPQLENQILIYQGGVPGQPFLLQPGAPPGNFLIPQPQPGFVLRDVPQRPYYPTGPQRPAFVPPVNKDAEEIPTNPAAIPPFKSQDLKPEKLETFDEKPENFQPDLENADIDRNPSYPKTALPGLKPGQRFFILNGQPLFSNYPVHPSFINQPSYQPNTRLYYQQPQEFSKIPPPQPLQQNPIEDFFLRNAVTGEISNVRPNYIQPELTIPQNFISLNQPVDYRQNSLLRYTLPLPITLTNKEIGVKSNNREAEKANFKNELKPIVVLDEEVGKIPDDKQDKSKSNLDYFRYGKVDDDNDAVVIEAKLEQNKGDHDSEVIAAQNDDREESSIAQAQPAAIALAGPGGVASAGPRGTSLVGDGGLAVSSPQATAVAGPRDEDKKNKNKKPK